MTDSAVQTVNTGAIEDFETLRAAVGPELSNSQLKLAMLYAEKVGADLFARQIYPVVVDNRLTFITSIDFLRVIAQRSGQYNGQGRVDYGDDCDCAGEEVRLQRRHPIWAEVPIYREGFLEPVVRRAYFHEYAPLERDGNNWIIKFTWRKMPHVMVAKVSEALGIRVAFPNDAAQLYTQDEMEQSGAIDVTPAQGRLSAGDIPPDAELPEGLTISGSASAGVDGVRMVKPPEWAKGLPTPTEKVEIKFKVGNRRHTALILGPLARLVDAAGVAADQRVAMDGKVVEIIWAQGKPAKKEVHGITRVALMVDNEWREVTAEAVSEDALAAIDPFAADAVPTPGGSSPDGPPTAATEAATASPTTATTDDDFGALLTGAPLASEDAAVIEAVRTDVSKAMSLSVWEGEDGKGMDLDVAVIELRADKTGQGVAFMHGWLMDPANPARFEAAMAQDEAMAQNVYDLVPGQMVRLVGTWTKAGGRGVVLVTAMVAG